MGNDTFVLASPSADEYVGLARTPTGKLYRKQILRYGTYSHPAYPDDPTKKLTIDEGVVDAVMENFRNGVADIVQLPMVDGKNAHVEDPERNLGEVIDLEKTTDGLYGVVDARRHADDFGKTLLGASALMHMNYLDTKTGKRVGPTLLHVAVTNRPFLTDLDPFEEIIAASADTLGNEVAVLTPEEETEMQPEMETATKEDLLEALKAHHGIDVEALMEAGQADGPSVAEMTAAFSAALESAGVQAPQPAEGEDITIRDVAEAVVEVAQERVQLSNRVAELEGELQASKDKAAEAEVDDLIAAGKVLPAKREVYVKLAQTDRETFESLIPEDSIVSLTQSGVTTHEEPRTEDETEEMDRLVAMANTIQAQSAPKKRKDV